MSIEENKNDADKQLTRGVAFTVVVVALTVCLICFLEAEGMRP